MTISREQVIQRLREAKCHYKRRAERVEIYKLANSSQRIAVPLRNEIPVPAVRIILRQARLTPRQIEEFLAAAVK